jgi:hypothetical protein
MYWLKACFKLLSIFKVRLYSSLKFSVEYNLDNFQITLPVDHLLPLYRLNYPTYDRFLPYLVKQFNDGALLIDVGANVGDTLVSLYLGKQNLDFICIEPDSRFFSYLLKNTSRIEKIDSSANIVLIQKLVGMRSDFAELIGKGGTKTAISTSGQTGGGSNLLMN